jgi:hypothetical protein
MRLSTASGDGGGGQQLMKGLNDFLDEVLKIVLAFALALALWFAGFLAYEAFVDYLDANPTTFFSK